MTWSRMFPRRWRERYGDEVDDLLRSSNRPLRDRFDLALAAACEHGRLAMETLARRGTAYAALVATAIALLVVGLAGGLWARGELAGGLPELHRHWWSSAAVAPAAVGAVLAVTACWARRKLGSSHA